jgi:hypothetical protein
MYVATCWMTRAICWSLSFGKDMVKTLSCSLLDGAGKHELGKRERSSYTSCNSANRPSPFLDIALTQIFGFANPFELFAD